MTDAEKVDVVAERIVALSVNLEPGEVFLSALHDCAEVLTALEALDVAEIVALAEPDALRAWAMLEDANRLLAGVRSQVQHQVAEAMSGHEVTVDGVGTFVRHVRKDRDRVDRDMLLRDVLDSRLVDTSTGEVADESPVDKVLKVWNLGAPRTTVLRQRGLDPDEYCRSEKRGFTIERI